MLPRQNLSFANLSPIQFNLPVMDTRHVKYLRVFDIAGSMVEMLVNGTAESGPSIEQGSGYINKQTIIL